MARQVISHNTYDSERSRLTLGVTNEGSPFLQLTEIFEAYIGKTPEKGAKVYNSDKSIFFPLSLHLIIETALVIASLEESEESLELPIETENKKRVLEIGRDVESDIWYLRLTQTEDEFAVEHVLPYRETSLGVLHVGIEALKAYLEEAKGFIFKMTEYNQASYSENSEGGEKKSRPSTLGGGGKLGSKLGSKLGGSSKSGGSSKLPPKRPVSASEVDEMLDGDDD